MFSETAAASANAFLFGLLLAIAIGPIALLIMNVAATSGLMRGLRCGLGAATADLLYGFLVFMGGHAAAPWIQRHDLWLHRAGGLLLVALAAHMLYGTLRPGVESDRPSLPSSRPFTATLLLTLANPLTIVAFSGLAVQLPLDSSSVAAGWFALCLFAGSLCSQSILAMSGGTLGQFATKPRWRMAVNLLSGAGILLFGLAGVCAAGTAR